MIYGYGYSFRNGDIGVALMAIEGERGRDGFVHNGITRKVLELLCSMIALHSRDKTSITKMKFFWK